jgi:hypothetical protein
MNVRERVALLWVIEGNRYLRVHRGRALGPLATHEHRRCV